MPVPDLHYKTFDGIIEGWESALLSILETNWQDVGNIKVKKFERLRILADEKEDYLPAIVVGHTGDFRLTGIVGGVRPVGRFAIFCVVPYAGTTDVRKHLETMVARVITILLNNAIKTEHWSELRIVGSRVLQSQEDPPRWDAAMVTCEIWGNPISLVT